MIKICKRCGQLNHHRKHSRGGFICYCLECEKFKNRESHANRKYYIVELLGGKCSCCGIEDHPCIYDAHHLNQSLKSGSCSKFSLVKLHEEISKCQLLCVRCHRNVEHKKHFNGKKQIWKKCRICKEKFWHEIKPRPGNFNSVNKRRKWNYKKQQDMLQKWELGKEICQQHALKKWNYKEWDSYCKKTFGIGSRGANDYERLFKEFSVDNLPSSLNGVRNGKHNSNLIEENSTTYVSNICVKCDNNRRRELKDKVKDMAIAYLGGKCYACNSAFESRAFDFHHLDPSLKEFKIANKSSFNEKLTEELDKCVLLCCYCHRKVHSGVLSIIDPLTF